MTGMNVSGGVLVQHVQRNGFDINVYETDIEAAKQLMRRHVFHTTGPLPDNFAKLKAELHRFVAELEKDIRE